MRLARYQRQIALALDDMQLAMKCTVNEAYNYIHAGEIAHAMRLIDMTERLAVERGDDLILGMCHSAAWFAEKVGEAGLKEEQSGQGAQATKDDFLRIRVLRNRSISESVSKKCP